MKILSLKLIFQRLPIAVAQIKVGIKSEDLLQIQWMEQKKSYSSKAN